MPEQRPSFFPTSVRNPPVLPREVRRWPLGWDTYILVFISKIHSSNSTLLTVVNQWMLNFIKRLSCLYEDDCFIFLPSSIIMVDHINIFPPTEPLFPYILEQSSLCQEVRFFSMYCGICFKSHTLNHWMVWWLRKSLDKWFSTGEHWRCLWYFWFSQLGTLVVSSG